MDHTNAPATEDNKATFMQVCPPMTLILRYAADDLPERYIPLLREHITGCLECSVRFAAIQMAAAQFGEQAEEEMLCMPSESPREGDLAGERVLTASEAREVATSVSDCLVESPSGTAIQREWHHVIPHTYALVVPSKQGKGDRAKVTFESAGRPGHRPDRSTMTNDPVASILDHLNLEDRVALFVSAKSPIIRGLLRAALRNKGRCVVFPVEVGLTWETKKRLNRDGEFPTIEIPRMESVRMSERVAATDGRYLMPSNAAVVAGMEFALSSGLIAPDPETRFVIVLPASNEPFNYFAYEDELIEMGLGHLIHTP